jgi:uroporphyrin-III C-methyltransferase/precorrin-2 dehydrogenase/sirohydrochlorin ferrochelatase
MQVVSRQPSEQGSARIQPLSVLPVFFDMTGKRTVVAGGTEGAAWKAELLAAAGADVHVYARQLSGEMARIVEHGSAITLHNRGLDAVCLSVRSKKK